MYINDYLIAAMCIGDNVWFMRYVCDDCNSIFFEPDETIPLGTNEIHDCCPMCKSVNISKDKSFEDSCKDLEAFVKSVENLKENLITIQLKANQKANTDYVIRFDDLIADMEEIKIIVNEILENLKRY